MTTILTEQDIREALRPLYQNDEAFEMAMPMEMQGARRIESAVIAKLSEGVELEPIARVFHEWPPTGPKLGWISHAAMNAAILDESHQEVKLVPLATAQAAVAAERVKLERWERAGALGDVLEERRRQVGTLGWTAHHDDEHANGELAIAAAAYADPAPAMYRDPRIIAPLRFPPGWDYKPKDYRSNLVRAAALLVAEIERVDRGGSIPPHLLIYRERIQMSAVRKAEIAREKAAFEADCARIPAPKDKP